MVTIIYTPSVLSGGINTAPKGERSLVLDASPTQNLQADVDVTEHPVEIGANISDHARAKSAILTVDGIISDTPLNAAQRTRAVNVQGIDFQTTAQEANQVLTGGGQAHGYADNALSILLEIKDSRQLLTVIADGRTYSNMIITSLSVPRDAYTGDAIKFNLSFKEIRLVTAQFGVFKVQAEKKTQGTAKLGPKNGKTKPGSDVANKILDNWGENTSEQEALKFGQAISLWGL